MFKLRNIVGPFIVNSRQDLTYVEDKIKEFHFELGERWKYDPHHIIFYRRKSVNSNPYTHESRPRID